MKSKKIEIFQKYGPYAFLKVSKFTNWFAPTAESFKPVLLKYFKKINEMLDMHFNIKYDQDILELIDLNCFFRDVNSLTSQEIRFFYKTDRFRPEILSEFAQSVFKRVNEDYDDPEWQTIDWVPSACFYEILYYIDELALILEISPSLIACDDHFHLDYFCFACYSKLLIIISKVNIEVFNDKFQNLWKPRVAQIEKLEDQSVKFLKDNVKINEDVKYDETHLKSLVRQHLPKISKHINQHLKESEKLLLLFDWERFIDKLNK